MWYRGEFVTSDVDRPRLSQLRSLRGYYLCFQLILDWADLPLYLLWLESRTPLLKNRILEPRLLHISQLLCHDNLHQVQLILIMLDIPVFDLLYTWDALASNWRGISAALSAVGCAWNKQRYNLLVPLPGQINFVIRIYRIIRIQRRHPIHHKCDDFRVGALLHPRRM